MEKNLLIHADNMDGLRYLLEEKGLAGQIDLVYIDPPFVYIDPPFATGGNFTITEGRAATISNSKNGTLAYADVLKGECFIQFLKERLLLIKDLLSDRGSVYLQ